MKKFYKWLYNWAFQKYAKLDSKSTRENSFRKYVLVLDHEQWALSTEVIGAEIVRNNASAMKTEVPEIKEFYQNRTSKITTISKALEKAISHL
jgi:hypothetical protein